VDKTNLELAGLRIQLRYFEILGSPIFLLAGKISFKHSTKFTVFRCSAVRDAFDNGIEWFELSELMVKFVNEPLFGWFLLIPLHYATALVVFNEIVYHTFYA